MGLTVIFTGAGNITGVYKTFDWLMRRLLNHRLSYLLYGLLFSVQVHAQNFFLVDAYANIYKSTAGATCTSTRLPFCVAGIGDIAYYKDTLYIISNSGLYRLIVSKPNVPCALVTSFGTFINSLTVDSTGTVYAAGQQGIYSYTPATGSIRFHGNLPAGLGAGGDLTFYNGKLYLAAVMNGNAVNAYLVEVNIVNPSRSFVYMTLKSKNVYGCITLPTQCGSNGLFITGQDDVSAFLTEVDMVNKKELNVKCTYDFSIYGAASFTESGTSSKPHVDRITTLPACSNGAKNASIQVTSGAGGSVLTYTLNGATSNQTGLFTGLDTGTYRISIAGESGCTTDTTVSVARADNNTFAVTGIPPSCTNNDGKISVQPLIPGINLLYSLNNGAYQHTDTFRSLAAGAYTVRAMTGNGCVIQKEVALALPLFQAGGSSIVVGNATCNRNNGSIQASAPGATKPVIFMLNGTVQSASGFFDRLAPAVYALTITDGNCCRLDTTLVVSTTTSAKPVTVVTGTPASCPNATDGAISLSINGTDGPYAVSVNNSAFLNRYAYPGITSGSYRFLVRDRQQCLVDTVLVQLAVTPNASCSSIYFPNAFTPGKKGVNDRYKPIVYGVPEVYAFSIYNRSGQKVFETRDPARGWDGTVHGLLQNAAGYVWVCKYKFYGSGRQELQKGTLLLIR